MLNLKHQIVDAEEAIRKGCFDSGKFDFASILPAKVDPADRLSLARLCRRCGHTQLALKVLAYPVFQKKQHRAATNEELAEYCMALRAVGALGEARLRLTDLDTRLVPEALRCEIYIALNQWDSNRALEACNEYIAQHETYDHYQLHVVKINRILAMIALGQYDHALQELAENMTELHLNQWNRLLLNAHELLAQIYMKKKNYDKAFNHLNLAERLGGVDGEKDILFINRWKAVIASRQAASEQPLIDFCEVAKEQRHYETIRAIDYERLLIRFDQRRFDHLYFGTPFPCYRERWLSWAKPSVENYVINPNARKLLDLENGTFRGEKVSEPTAKTFTLIQALLSDFYRPLQLGDLFEKVFPEEAFDSERSFQRLHQLIYRTRNWCDEHQIPLELMEHDKQYSLVVGEPLQVSIPKHFTVGPFDHKLKVLREHFANSIFTTKEAMQVLEISNASAHRVLNQGIDSGILQRTLFGIHTSYQFCTHTVED